MRTVFTKITGVSGFFLDVLAKYNIFYNGMY